MTIDQAMEPALHLAVEAETVAVRERIFNAKMRIKSYKECLSFYTGIFEIHYKLI